MAGVNKYSVRTAPRAENPWCTSAPARSVYLAPNTDYWVYMWAGDATTTQLARTNSGGETREPGWKISNERLSKPNGSAYSNYSPVGSPIKIQVKGTVNHGVRILIEGRVSVTEGVDDAAEFQVKLDKAAFNVVTVDYETANQTAFAPADFEATSGTLTFQPGERVKDGVGTDRQRHSRQRERRGVQPEVEQRERRDHRHATGVATIVDPGVLAISITDASGSEDDGKIDFVISLNRASTNTVTVQASTSQSGDADETDDYIPKVRIISFAPGETEKTFSVQIVDDTVNDDGERPSRFFSTTQLARSLPKTGGSAPSATTRSSRPASRTSRRTTTAAPRSPSTSISRATSRSPRPQCATTRSPSPTAT